MLENVQNKDYALFHTLHIKNEKDFKLIIFACNKIRFTNLKLLKNSVDFNFN